MSDGNLDEEDKKTGFLNHSKRSRHELDVVNKLHNTGVQVDIDLPQIIIAGSQSSGKSSLMEAVCGVPFPRNSGTCTRCPTECRLSRSDAQWQCKVLLHFVADINGIPLGQVSSKPFGNVIYNKSEVEDRIRRAQRAILNPNKPAEYFLGDSWDSEEELQTTFSMNTVVLEISGPGVPDLSFCDLPGLIASVSSASGTTNDIKLVEDMVTSYMKKPSCIILLIVACETDFENQGAHRLAKSHDPDGERTIGVLTKVDRIPTGEESNWLKFVRNEKEPLKNNWFCVQQPTSEQLKAKITWEQARANERAKFAEEPWSGLDTIYRHYLGTDKLVQRLSNVLSDLISKRMPKIQQAIQTHIETTRHLLSMFPPPPSTDPHSEILTLLHNFTTDLDRHIYGIPADFESELSNGLIQSIRPSHERFRNEIRNTAPVFLPSERILYEEAPMGMKASLARPASIPYEEALVTPYMAPLAPIIPFLKAEEGDIMQRTPESERIYMDEVMEIANNARTRELPGHYPFVVQRMLISKFLKKWSDPSVALCESVHSTVSQHVEGLVSMHFGQFGQGILKRRISGIMEHYMQQCLERTKSQILRLVRMEEWPFSLNTHYFADYRSKFLTHYKGARERAQQHNFMGHVDRYTASGNAAQQAYNNHPSGVAKVLSGLAEIGLSGIKAEDLPKLLPTDQMEPALGIMADVRAYFQVAYKRFVDNVPLAIDLELVRGVNQGILPILFEGLGINGPDGEEICRTLSEESAQISERRTELQKKLARLENARKEIISPGL